MPDPFYINIDTPGRVKVNRIVISGFEIQIKESVIMPDDELRFYDERGNLIGKIVNVQPRKAPTMPNRKPPEKPPTMHRMRISLPGVLKRAANCCDRESGNTLGYSLRELLKHLRIVRDDPAQLADFLDLWVDE